jgi:hypothetical protein
MTPDLPNIDELDSERLLALRSAIDARLEAIRAELIAQAERLGLAVSDGKEKKRRGRKPKRLDNATEAERTSS